ncbi:Axonemal dynein light chain domain-containing protein 1 [Geodia barretti]|nr:Axonemal dynein light chain domain-containing protein 1 [Geodia barretti]
MAASSVAEPATCLPLPDSPSSQSPPPPPPTASGLELQDPLSSDREHEQLGVLLSPNKSQRTPDFLPPRMLQALKQQQQQQQLQWDKEQSTSPRRLQQSPKKDSECGLPSVRPPAKLWSYPRQRSKFTHLTTHPPCVCGAGSRDISFLYDVPEDQKGKEQKELPPSLIPNEYHIHKKVGVVGLEFREDQYTTQSVAHDNHVTVFPSINPSSRYEVLALKSTMDAMLEKAGLPREDTQMKGPTQVHNLLELVRQEQIIYSVCFHEVIRQVSVQCAERGELLQEIRSRYTQLLDRIPRQVMSLHEDMLSQRALCKRISAEFRQFRSKIASVTDRLGRLREIDTQVVKETRTAHRDLLSALTESERNGNLLKEYHGVYELQRKRLLESVDKVRQERCLWEGAAYSLAKEVMKEEGTQELRTLRRLQLWEKAWAQQARHFTTLLCQADIRQLGEVDECVRRWREGVMSENGRLEEVESALNDRLSEVEDGMKRWREELSGADGRVIPLSQGRLQQLWEELGVWLRVLNSESDQYSGETQLARTQGLLTLHSLVERWTEVGLEVFSRHQEMNQYDRAPSDHTHSPEHERMLSLGGEVELAMRHCTARASGDNGVAVGFIRLVTPLETWESRLGQCVSGKTKLPESDWINLRSLLGEWLEHLQKIRGFVGKVTDEEGHTLKCTPMRELSVAVEKWRGALSHAIFNRHTKIVSMVTDLHSSLVLWMVRLLLTFTRTTWVQPRTLRERGGEGEEEREEREGEGEETREETREKEEDEGKGLELGLEGEKDSWDQGMGLSQLLAVDLQEEYKTLSSSIKKLTTSLTR